MPTFVDRVILHLVRRQRRPRLRLGPPREVQAARRPRRRQRRPRRRRHPRGRPERRHAARLPLPPAPQGHLRQGRAGQPPHRRRGRRPAAPGPRRHRRRRRRDRRAARRPGRRRHPLRPRRRRRGGLGNAALASTQRKAPGFALLGEPGEDQRRRAGAQVGRRRGARRLPERGQVLADRGDVGGQAQDRRLPVHHARAQPRRRRPPARRSTPSPTCPG